jgi:TRAP-type C4-dicarboxylate transport system permease small subunit
MVLQKGIDLLVRINQPLVALLKHIALWTLAMMMFLTFVSVLLRYVFNSPIPGVWELTEFMMAIVITFSLVYTAHQKAHIGVDLIINLFGINTRKLIECVTSLLSLCIFIFITWQTFVKISDDFHSSLTSPVLYIPVYPFVAIAAFGFLVLCLVFLADFLNIFSEVIAKWTRL